MSRATLQQPSPLEQKATPTAPHWQAADLIVAYLEQIGVDYIFGVPGGAIEPLYNALARSSRRGGLRPIVARHESGAAFMADGYYRETGKLGVCCATTGPGATNLLTGVSSAYENDIPMLVITGQTALPNFGKGAFQESSCTGLNTLGMFEHCTHYNSLISHAAQIEQKLATAVRTAFFSRGPSHLSIPLDVGRQRIESNEPSYSLAEYIRKPALVDNEAIAALQSQLQRAKKPVLLIGGGCTASIDALLEFALWFEIPFVTTPEGKGLVSPWHPLYYGVFGFAGHASAHGLLSDADTDLVLAVGTSFSEWKSAGWDAALMNGSLIHISDSEKHLLHSPMARMHVYGDIRLTFERLLSSVHAERAPGTVRLAQDRAEPGRIKANEVSTPHAARLDQDVDPKCIAAEAIRSRSDQSPIKPQRLLRELGRLFPTNTRFFADTGNSVAWATHYLHPLDHHTISRRGVSSNRLHLTSDFATMGWAIGSAVGCAMGNREANVVCITGDGSFLMSGQELTVAVSEQLNVIFVILNDSALGMVKHGQQLAGAEPVGFALPHVNFAAIAGAMGAHGVVIDSPQALLDLDITALCTRGGPAVLDVRIDGSEVPPMAIRMKVLQSDD